MLAQQLADHAGREGLLVLALPRGGVPVGFEVASALDAPLDVFVVRKIGVPFHEELAMGAVASGGVRVVNEHVVEVLGITEEQFEAAAAAETAEVERRERLYRGDQPPVDVHGRHVILVDDGLATGSTMRAAARALRAQQPQSLTVAVPVAAEETCYEVRSDIDEIVCGFTPQPFLAVGVWYEDFRPTSDDEVRELLAQASQLHRNPSAL